MIFKIRKEDEMKRQPWKSKLTKKELSHLKEIGIMTKKVFQENINKQEKIRQENNNPVLEPCWECRGIAGKLGMKPKIDT